jgi:hypothetical protein
MLNCATTCAAIALLIDNLYFSMTSTFISKAE